MVVRAIGKLILTYGIEVEDIRKEPYRHNYPPHDYFMPILWDCEIDMSEVVRWVSVAHRRRMIVLPIYLDGYRPDAPLPPGFDLYTHHLERGLRQLCEFHLGHKQQKPLDIPPESYLPEFYFRRGSQKHYPLEQRFWYLTACLRLKPTYPIASTERAQVLMAMGHAHAALYDINCVIQPGMNDYLLISRARILTMLDRYEDAFQDYAEVGAYKQAAADFTQVLEIQPDNEELKKYLKLAQEKLS
jgi:hypothetical protein